MLIKPAMLGSSRWTDIASAPGSFRSLGLFHVYLIGGIVINIASILWLRRLGPWQILWLRSRQVFVSTGLAVRAEATEDGTTHIVNNILQRNTSFRGVVIIGACIHIFRLVTWNRLNSHGLLELIHKILWFAVSLWNW
jgi:hypothetical protein